MIKKEIIEKISKYFKLSQFEAEKIYDDIFSIIIKGVKDDNVTDVTNFGEFITKYNGKNGNGNGDDTNGYKKTVEFLASSSLEEELNQVIKENTKPDLENLQTTPMNTDNNSSVSGASPLEDEFKKKREALLNKISIHPLQDSAREKKQREELAAKNIEQEPLIPVPIPVKETLLEDVKPINEKIDMSIEENVINKIKEEPEPKDTSEADEYLSQKSFSDYFTEVKKEEEHEFESGETGNVHEMHVIPQSAVELHNEITHTTELESEHLQESPIFRDETPLIPPVKENLGDSVERINEDNSYYIWYKDSEANVNETQTMSYEYELLYQATKEAEYKSKVRIYVTTFLVFFSVVLVLLIFSPIIYKVFFTPENQIMQVNELQNEGTTDQTNTQGNENAQIQQTQSIIPPSDTVNKQVQSEQVPPVTQQQQPPNQEQPKQEQVPPVTQQQKQQIPPPQQEKQQVPPSQQNEINIAGVTRNTMGWADDKFKVIYIKLDNGKFTIQESAWDSDAKASKRINAVEGFKIGGLKGTVVKADLGNKGVWFRARFGEFSTIEEARIKAEELRNKERIRFQALLACFLLFT